MLPLGAPAPEFSLPDAISGKTYTLADLKESNGTVVMFICNHCPYVKHLKEALTDLALDYLDQGIGFVAISSNDAEAYPQDGPEAMAEDAKQFQYPFPYLFDADQSVAKAYKAACTPDFFVFDRNTALAYRGQFDDTRPNHRTAPDGASKGARTTGRDIRAALDAMLAGNSIPEEAQKPSLGCNIKWIPGNEPDYFG